MSLQDDAISAENAVRTAEVALEHAWAIEAQAWTLPLADRRAALDAARADVEVKVADLDNARAAWNAACEAIAAEQGA